MAATSINGGVAADEHDELPLFRFQPSSPCAHYYVQSPSAASHAPSHVPASESSMALILSPFPNLHRDADTRDGDHDHEREEASRLVLSRYSSSRGSNNSFPAGYDKKPSRHRQMLAVLSVRPSSGGDDDEEDDNEDAVGGAGRRAFQVAWRVAASAAFALLVFVLATRPRRPGVAFRFGRVERFSVGEGLDGSGVETSFLNCNCSVEMVVDNRSKVFSLHVRPPLLEMSFGRFVFATSQGDGEEWAAHDVAPRATSTRRLFVAAKEKPMYAAGRAMQDLLESSRGLPLTITVRSRSRYRMMGAYRHDSECVVRLRRSPRLNNAITTVGSASCSALS